MALPLLSVGVLSIHRLGRAILRRSIQRLRFGPLEWLLLASAAALLIQLFPMAGSRLMRILDFRNWTIAAWCLAGVVGITLFIARRRSANWRDSFVVTGEWITGFLVCMIPFSIAAILCRAFPKVEARFLGIVDPRNWSQAFWWYSNLGVIAIVFTCRFSPEWKSAWKAKRAAKIAKASREAEIAKRREYRLHLEEIQKRAKKGIDFY